MWAPSPRSDTASAAIKAAEADRELHPQRYSLDPELIATAAARRPEDPASFSEGWGEGLEQYLRSARVDGRLNALGIAMVARNAISRLRSGVSLARFHNENPQLMRREMQPPIFITGGWRTGTTFLFRLLASDTRLRAPLPIELTSPIRVATSTALEREQLVDSAGASHDLLHALNPDLRAIHDSGSRLPEECVLGMGSDLRNWAFASNTRLDSYVEWLSGQDMTPSYALYRMVLAALDVADGRRWVLKAPPHLAELPALATAFPAATVVILHRDMVQTVTSGASLFATFRSTYSDHVDPIDVGRFQSDQMELWLRRSIAARNDERTRTLTFLDLQYEDLVADPVGTLAKVYEAAGLGQHADNQTLVREFNESNPRHGHGTHRYRPGDFGLNERSLRERFAFAT